MGSCASCSPTKAPLDVPGWHRRDGRTRRHLRVPPPSQHTQGTADPGDAFSKGGHDGTNSPQRGGHQPLCRYQKGAHGGHESPGDGWSHQQHRDSKATGDPSRASEQDTSSGDRVGAAGAARRALVALTLLFLPDRMHSSILCGGAGQWICRNTGDGECGAAGPCPVPSQPQHHHAGPLGHPAPRPRRAPSPLSRAAAAYNEGLAVDVVQVQ